MRPVRLSGLGLIVFLAILIAWPLDSARAAPSGLNRASVVITGQNHVHCIVIEPNNPNDLFVGTHYRLYHSTDGGRHWHALLSQMMITMVLDPAHPSTLYGVTLQSGLVKSTDNGVHWRKIQAGLPKSVITGVTYDPVSRSVIAYGSGIYRSTDGGAHWRLALKGQSLSIANVAVGSGADYAASGNGLYVSHDAGQHWSLSRSVGNQPVVQVAAAGRVAYAAAAIAMLKSTDAGRTWKTLNAAPAGIEFLGVSPTDPNEVLGEVFGRGFVGSYDGGRTWHSANSGIHDTNFVSSTVRVAPSSPQIAYTGSWGVHFYATHDGGRRWSEIATLVH